MNDTIVAISTALSKSAISIVRLSGPQALFFVNQVFDKDLLEAKTHTIHYGHIVHNNKILDEVLVGVYRAPKTYTGEDVVEVNCHGGLAITQMILSLFIDLGARLAQPGEFTQRAFLSGRIDLSQAEAVMDMIDATSPTTSQLAMQGILGSVGRLIKPLMTGLMDVIAHIETNIDYPEYDDVEILTHQVVVPKVVAFKDQLKSIYDKSQRGQVFKEGVKTLILGKPNVGKSSLLNALLEEDKAIVTDIAGTTRDLVEGLIHLDQVTLNLIDTAGIRETDDQIEKIGIDKTLAQLDQAQLVLVILESGQPLDDQDQALLDLTKDKNRILVYNKNDLAQICDDQVRISAASKDVSALILAIQDRMQDLIQLQEEPLLANQRQLACLLEALGHLDKALDAAEAGMELDLVNLDLLAAYQALASILGDRKDLDLAHEIFSRFCLGK